MKCKFVKANREVCKANHINGSKFCFRHDPRYKEASIVASTKGGLNRTLQGVYGAEIRLGTPSDIREFIGTVISGVWTGKVPVPVGTSMGFLAKCWLEAHNAAELDNRVKLLEERIGRK